MQITIDKELLKDCEKDLTNYMEVLQSHGHYKKADKIKTDIDRIQKELTRPY